MILILLYIFEIYDISRNFLVGNQKRFSDCMFEIKFQVVKHVISIIDFNAYIEVSLLNISSLWHPLEKSMLILQFKIFSR